MKDCERVLELFLEGLLAKSKKEAEEKWVAINEHAEHCDSCSEILEGIYEGIKRGQRIELGNVVGKETSVKKKVIEKRKILPRVHTDKFVIQGGTPLRGKVKISGARSDALSLMAASLLVSGKTCLENVPELADIVTMGNILERLGAKVVRKKRSVEIDARDLSGYEIPDDVVTLMMDASILVLGPLLARFRQARAHLPYALFLGEKPRVVGLTLMGLQQLGARIEIIDAYIEGRIKDNLCGNSIYLSVPAVAATLNLTCAASLANGITLIENASRAPEVVNLAVFLRKMGAHIEGEGTNLIKVRGVRELQPAHYSVIPDSIEAGTLGMAALITGGEVTLERICSDHLAASLSKLKEMGADYETIDHSIWVKGGNIVRPVEVKTLPYPGFSPNLQPQITSVTCLAEGTSRIAETVGACIAEGIDTTTKTILKDRFAYVRGLRRMGARIREQRTGVEIKGVSFLRGNSVVAPNAAGGLGLVLAGLAAKGITEVADIYHVDAGHERLEQKLSKLGAKIERIKN